MGDIAGLELAAFAAGRFPDEADNFDDFAGLFAALAALGLDALDALEELAALDALEELAALDETTGNLSMFTINLSYSFFCIDPFFPVLPVCANSVSIF